MDAGPNPLIVIRNLCKSFEGVQVLRDVSFSIAEGDLVSIIGPSGCGKSTLLRCLNSLELLDSGTITIAGLKLHRDGLHQKLDSHFYARAHALREEVGMVFQSPNLFPTRTILENVMLAPMVVKKESREVAESKAMRFLEKVGLEKYKDRLPHKVSGGQQQRAGIARALAMSPKVILYDEPTLSLDPGLVEEVLQVMRDLDREGMTQIIVTHEMSFARDASDYIIYMEGGEIVEISDEDEIFISPKDSRTKRFLARHARA